MSENKIFELWLGEYSGILKMKEGDNSDSETVRDYFVRKILQRHIPGFSKDNLLLNEHGKPELKGKKISFNLSHCGKHFALLVCNQEFCGIDIQFAERKSKFENALKSVLTDSEYSFLTEKGSDNDYFQLWSLKEAFIKAKGGSIWMGRDYEFLEILDQYSGNWTNIYNMQLFSVEIYPGTFLSIAVPYRPGSIDFRKFEKSTFPDFHKRLF